MTNKSHKLREVLLAYFKELKAQNIKYAVIGNYEDLPDYTENDVDVYVSNHALAKKILYTIAAGNGIQLYLANNTAVGSNNYFYFYGGDAIEIIKIDLMIETAWISLIPIINAEVIEENIIEYKNFHVVSKELESCMHLIYPLVTFNIIKDKYKNKLSVMAKNDLFAHYLDCIVGSRLANMLITMLSDKKWDDIEKSSRKVKKKILSKFILKMITLNGEKRFFLFSKTVIERLFNQNGLLIAFAGVDGAGKTTIINQLAFDSERYFIKGKTKKFYWRPFLLPRLALLFKKQDSNNEEYDILGKRIYQNSLKNSFISFVKYLYYVLDYIFGRILYLSNIKTGGLVIFDRYHFDNIVYPERFGFSVNHSFMRFVDKWCIPRPDILFYLSADSNELYERKKEISVEVINSQKKRYKAEISSNGNIIEIDTGKSFRDTNKTIILRCLETMAKRYKDDR